MINKEIHIKLFLMLIISAFILSPINAQNQHQKNMNRENSDSLILKADGEQINKKVNVGAVSTIDIKKISNYPDLVLTNALQGKVAGLQIRSSVSGLGNNIPNIYIRGLHGINNNSALVVIDGMERPMSDLLPEEIESIQIFKDATAKVLFGSRAANGVVWITTRRGKIQQTKLKFSIETGVTQMTRMPEFINSYQYVNLYNEARENDGLSPFYSEEQISGYKNSKGANDLLYPDVDYQKAFLNDNALYRKATLSINGGNKNVRYALETGYTGSNGFENANHNTNLNRLNLRGNLDITVTDYLDIVADVAGRMEFRKWGALDYGQMFSAISSHRSNEYPLNAINVDVNGYPIDLLDQSSAEGVEISDIPTFIGSLLRPNNLYESANYGGYTEERYTTSQTNLGFKLKLDKVIKGLKASGYITFDNYDYFKLGLNKTYPTYAYNPYINELGENEILVTRLKKLNIETTQSRQSVTLKRDLGWRSNITYDSKFGLNVISGTLAYQHLKIENQGLIQDILNSNTSLRMNYVYDNRYSIEMDGTLMGSNHFKDSDQYYFSPAVGVAWIISNEKFFHKNNQINSLKIKASYGKLGYDRSTGYFLQNKEWSQGNTYKFGSANNGYTSWITNMLHEASPDLKWENSEEYNIGFEGNFLNNRLSTALNYYHEKRINIIGSTSATYGDYLGDFTYLDNMGSVMNQGLELQMTWSDKINDLFYSVNGNLAWTKNKVLAWNVVDDGEDYRSIIGKPSDSMIGLKAQGLFKWNNALDIETHPLQSFGEYQNGDIAYEDINNDNVIDNRDVESLGNSFPRMTIGLNANFKYKSWGLTMNGYAELGVDTWTTNTYYWNRGEGKYSILALKRYSEIHNMNGTYPRLTTTSGDNNYRNSSFWLKNADFFRMKNLELSYTINLKSVNKLNRIKLYMHMTNLFVISSIKDLDPENIDAGVTNYPMTRTVTGGVTFTF